MNRRDFFKVAGAVMAGGAIPAASPEKGKPTFTVDDSGIGLMAPAFSTLSEADVAAIVQREITGAFAEMLAS